MRPPQTFDVAAAQWPTQTKIAAALIVAQKGGDPSRLIRELVQDLESSHYPDSYIYGVLMFIRARLGI